MDALRGNYEKLVDLEQRKWELQRKLKEIEDRYREAILSATDEKGKKFYSNQETRELELRKRLREDFEYEGLLRGYQNLKVESMKLMHNIDLLKRKYEVNLILLKKKEVVEDDLSKL